MKKEYRIERQEQIFQLSQYDKGSLTGWNFVI